MTKKGWRFRVRNSVRKIMPAKVSEEYLSVDTTESRTPEFIAELKGKLMRH